MLGTVNHTDKFPTVKNNRAAKKNKEHTYTPGMMMFISALATDKSSEKRRWHPNGRLGLLGAGQDDAVIPAKVQGLTFATKKHQMLPHHVAVTYESSEFTKLVLKLQVSIRGIFFCWYSILPYEDLFHWIRILLWLCEVKYKITLFTFRRICQYLVKKNQQMKTSEKILDTF